MNKSENINELAKALSFMQAELNGAKKDASNPFFKSKYADLESCWNAIKEPLTKNGLSISQLMDESDTGVVVETILMHSSGQWISGKLKMTPIKNDPQGIGSCISYARRYALASCVGLVQVDDDANYGSGKEDNVRSVTPTPFKKDLPKTEPEVRKQDDFYRQALLTALKSEGIPSEFVLEGCHKTNWIDRNVSSIGDFPEGKAQALLERLPKLKETWLKSQEVK